MGATRPTSGPPSAALAGCSITGSTRKILTGQWGDGATLPGRIKLSIAFGLAQLGARSRRARLTAERTPSGTAR